jgi:hypothetical protein
MCFVAYIMWNCCCIGGKICLGRDYFICCVLYDMLGMVAQSLV